MTASARAAAAPVIESAAGRPHPGLRGLVAHYSGYRRTGVEPARHAGLPSPYLTVIVTLDEPLTVAAHPDPRQPAAQYVTLVGGLHTAPALVTHDGRQSCIQIAMSPLGARQLLGLPAGELANIDVEGTDVLGPLAAEIQQRVRAALTWPDRFALIDRALLARLGHAGPGPAVAGEVAHAWQQLLATGGTAPVTALAQAIGWSERHLRTRFAAELGLTPKAAARVIRFDRARRIVQRRASAGHRLDLAGLAVRCGYYDQAHLDLDFRSFAGSAPTTWLAREFRNFQASTEVRTPGWSHDEHHSTTSGLADAAGA